jgi:hypothetical protein
MKIKMLKELFFGSRTHLVSEVIEVDEARGKRLVVNGYAVPYVEPIETATVKPAKESADLPQTRKGGK